MKKVLKWIGIALAGLLGLVLIAAVGLYLVGSSKLNKRFSVQTASITVPADPSSIARGEHLVQAVSGCQTCHGERLEGQIFVNSPAMAVLAAPNLTSGAGGVGKTFTDADWMLAIRHGVTPDHRGLLLMPSQYFSRYSDEDLAAIIAYLKSLPPVDNPIPDRKVGPVGKLMVGAGQLPPLPATRIDHSAKPPAPVPGPTAEYGAYLVTVGFCRECHAENLAGNTNPNGPPPGPNLTQGGEMRAWTEADFINTIRTGVKPGAIPLSEEMPWKYYQKMTDEELKAIWAYLNSLPATTAQSN